MGYALYTLYGHQGASTAVNFSPEGDYFASGGADSVVMTWLSNLDYSSNAPIPEVSKIPSYFLFL
jgi:centriolar protein POC1